MKNHEQKISQIAKQLQSRKTLNPVSLKKKSVSHEVPKLKDKRHTDEKIDISELTKILEIDTQNNVCIAESGVTFVDLVTETLQHGLVPIIVPELKTITIGGAVSGCSIESMSFKQGGFHDTCLEYEVITAQGDILLCTPDNENKLLFQMMHGTFGTLGILTKLKFKLIPAKPFVKVTYEKYSTLESYKKAIWQRYLNQDVDFMDGIIHSPTQYVLSLANFVDEAPYTHNYDWLRIYYKSTLERTEDFLTTKDYFFRYNKGVTNVRPKSFLGRLLFGRFVNSSSLLRFVQKFRRFIPPHEIPITLDTFIPFSRIDAFMSWYQKEVDFFPLWCVPYKIAKKYDWIADGFFDKTQDELFLDIALYGMKKRDKNYYRMFEEELMLVGGIKTLISENFYSEEEFWKIWNKNNYFQVKQRVDPNNIFRDLYTKTCKTMRGLD